MRLLSAVFTFSFTNNILYLLLTSWLRTDNPFAFHLYLWKFLQIIPISPHFPPLFCSKLPYLSTKKPLPLDELRRGRRGSLVAKISWLHLLSFTPEKTRPQGLARYEDIPVAPPLLHTWKDTAIGGLLPFHFSFTDYALHFLLVSV